MSSAGSRAAPIGDEQVDFFASNGFAVLPGLIAPRELERLQAATARLVESARDSTPDGDANPQDYEYAAGHDSGGRVLKRIEYVVERLPECRALLAHPAVLSTVARLMGPDLLPTWDSMVVKMPGEGAAVPWHRDAPTTQVGDHPIFNVDCYLDASDAETALWVLPGSHRLDDRTARSEAIRRGDASEHADGFDKTGAIQLPLRPGDVLLHDVLLLHGSSPARGNALRRVVYFEYRSARVELERGPHTPAYIPRKQQVLAACIEARRVADYVDPSEEAFVYALPAPFDAFLRGAPTSFRHLHAAFWRARA